MSTVQANQTFFHGGGIEHAGTQRPDNHPLVVDHPMFYEPFDQFEEPVRRGPGRPAGSKNKPKETPAEEEPDDG